MKKEWKPNPNYIYRHWHGDYRVAKNILPCDLFDELMRTGGITVEATRPLGYKNDRGGNQDIDWRAGYEDVVVRISLQGTVRRLEKGVAVVGFCIQPRGYALTEPYTYGRIDEDLLLAKYLLLISSPDVFWRNAYV